MAFSGLRKMLTLIIFNTWGVWVLVCPIVLMETVVNGDHIVMADIMVFVRLRSNIKVPRAYYIAKRAEKQLLNERIRSINNNIEMFEHQRDTCMDHLTKV